MTLHMAARSQARTDAEISFHKPADMKYTLMSVPQKVIFTSFNLPQLVIIVRANFVLFCSANVL